MTPLTFENDLVTPGSYEKFITGCDDSTLVKAEIARVQLNSALALAMVAEDTSIAKVVENRSANTAKDDASFIVDNAFLAGMEGEQGAAIMRKKLLSQFPTEGTLEQQYTIQAVAANVQQIACSSLAKFVGPVIRGHLDTVVSITTALKRNVPPAFTAAKMVPLVNDCVDRMSFLCIYPPKGEKSSNRVFSQDALEARYTQLCKLADNVKQHAELLTPGAINDFKICWWLVKPEWQATIDRIDSLIRQRNGVEAKEADAENVEPDDPSAGSSSAPAAKKAKKTDSAKDQVMASVMSKFGGF